MPPAQRTSFSARRVFAAALLALGLGGVSSIALGQKELHWKALDLSARLDADGRLHVIERHAMVFTGDWNGGERIFRIAPGQTLAFERIRRIDPAVGPDSARELAGGDLNQNDHFQFTNPTTLRWRSRLSSDPAFADTEIDYEISYVLAGVLLKQGDRYVLDHNFALPDANKAIEAFSVDLELDPAWTPPPGFARRRTTRSLTPGENFVVHAELDRAAGAGAAPSAVRVGTTKPIRVSMFLLLLLSVVAMGIVFYRREATLGRLDVPANPDAIDEAWLDRNLFTLLPEEAGALWDDTVGAPEVTAVLARLTGEKKLETVASGKEMTMRLKVPLDTLHGYERDLVQALFFGGRTETSTSEIKKHYKSSGFDPASKIKPGVLEKLAKHADFQDRSGRPGRALTFALFAAGLAILVFEALSGAVAWGTVIGGVLFATGIWWAIGLGFAIRYQNLMDRLLPWAISFLFVPLLFLWSSWGGIASAGITPLPVLIGRLALWLAAVNNLFNVAKTRSGPKKVARRRELVAARRFFERELSRSAPRLKDAWFPWLAAFGLGPDVDRWFRSFGGAATSASSGSSFSSSSSSSSSSSGSFSGESGGFTGGGGFSGGAGSSGSWAVAAGAIASGVSAPSSSSGGGGGGGGGGSSGGGGGGGW